MPRAWNLFRYAQIKIKLKANSVTSPRSDVSGNVHAHMHTYRCTHIDTDCWDEMNMSYRFGIVLPTQDRIYSHSLSLSLSRSLSLSLRQSHSVCLSAYLLTKELSLCLSGRIVLNGDFLCNHLIIHQFSKKPQRGCISTLCWRAQQWETGVGRGGVSWRKWSKWILASLPATGICI